MRYIDLDKALAILENSLNWCETQLGDTNKEYKKGCISAIQDDISNISHMKTEDVVPRAEVEVLETELSRYTENCKQMCDKAKQEVVRDIVDEFENSILNLSTYGTINISREQLEKVCIKLKKKYIGE